MIIFLEMVRVLYLDWKKSIGLACPILKKLHNLSAHLRGDRSSVMTRICYSFAAIVAEVVSAMAGFVEAYIGACVCLFDVRFIVYIRQIDKILLKLWP